MDKMVETKVKACLPCQVVTPVYTRELLQMSVLPDNPFDQVSVDFAHVDGQTLLLVVDDYSRFPFVEQVSSTSASAVISKLDQLFSTFGASRVVKSDNGPPFNGEEFAKFTCGLGFKHRKVTPLWPRANGEVERFVKTRKKCIKAAKVEGRNWRKELQAIFRNYRTTPHATTGVAPAVMLLKRSVRNKLPQDLLFKTLILSIFTYAIEVWGGAFYNKYLSRIDKFLNRAFKLGYTKVCYSVFI